VYVGLALSSKRQQQL